MPKMLDLIKMVQSGELPPPPMATLIGFTIRSIEPGDAVMEMEAGPQHANPMGTIHGGVLCDLADAAMGMAYASSLDGGETFTTLELMRWGSWSATSTTTRTDWWHAHPAPA
jgi:acyl-coenzyme A thioesterase PaaI-like protein